MKPDIIVGKAHWSEGDQAWGWFEFARAKRYRPDWHQCAAAFTTVAEAVKVRDLAVKRYVDAGLIVQDGPVTKWHVVL